ncbi:hypothetical protein BpHYR1_022640 [Brachionus plicatilis]|uniref:Secreted protein n=1 Tax=Brachionus plicatilis TaxID=10195 RepID=A0A3M7QFM6_BRAPC|nr:hypothetical protein BpHYR1_022640 [Brachionus plicatilis]
MDRSKPMPLKLLLLLLLLLEDHVGGVDLFLVDEQIVFVRLALLLQQVEFAFVLVGRQVSAPLVKTVGAVDGVGGEHVRWKFVVEKVGADQVGLHGQLVRLEKLSLREVVGEQAVGRRRAGEVERHFGGPGRLRALQAAGGRLAVHPVELARVFVLEG